MTQSFANFALDVLDQFSSVQASGSPWALANSISKQLGVTAVNVAVLERRNGTPIWFQSSMHSDWLEEYVANNYITCDPLLPEQPRSGQLSVIKSGTLSKTDAPCAQSYALNHALTDARYNTIRAQTYAGTLAEHTKLISLSSDMRASDLLSEDNKDKLNFLSAMLAAHLGDTSDPAAPQLFDLNLPALTLREKEVLSLLAAGHQNARIAERLNIAVVTVRFHMQSARRKLGAKTREQALAIAISRGHISL